MAAYASLVSVMHIIDNLELHPSPPISLHKEHVASLKQKITFLQEFLEDYNPQLGYSTEADPFESRIADAAYEAEDVIESHIVDRITNDGGSMSSDGLCEALEKVIQDMASIEKEAIRMKGRERVQNQLHKNTTPLGSSGSSPSIVQKSSMVGADDVLLEMKHKLTSHCSDLQIIPIVGMGGTGKTALAMNIYHDRLIKERFDICAWATISQEYSIKEILAEILHQLNRGVGQNSSEDELGRNLYKHLYGRRYLIIMDDIWSVDAWDRVRFCFPDNQNGSRIVITTRLSNLASDLTGSKGLVEMSLLDEANSWELFSKTVFGDKSCPLELEEIGKAIGLSCKGLPLSIVVVGGLLAKSKQTIEFWEYIVRNLISAVNSEDDERCPNILYMSYKELPVYLKPCFLYMGVYPEDGVIRVSKLVKLWVAEGFLKPISGKSLEEIAKEYLKELSDRNLVLIHKVGSTGNIKQCKIHDLLRDLCLREAQKQRFYGVIGRPLEDMGNAVQRRIVIPISTSKNEAMIALSSMPLARSLMWYLHESLLPSLSLRLLRILDSRKIFHRHCLGMNLHQLVNSRFLTISDSSTEGFNFPASSVSRFWNLQTFMGMGFSIGNFSTGPIDIWCMPLIRNVHFHDLHLPDPPDSQDGIVLENLQTLGRVRNFKCSEQVVKRIPNVKKLKIYNRPGLDDDVYSLSNLGRFHKLESLDCSFYAEVYPSIPASLPCLINFPDSLKKLALGMSSSVLWEEILDKIGALPLLQKLKLKNGSFKEGQWKTTEGRFPNLKFLLLDGCTDLRVWIAESSHFPCLEHLHLWELDELEEIPIHFAEISTLRVIEVHRCGVSAVESAKRILDEQEELYGEEEAAVQVQVSMWRRNEAVERLASSNFHVRWIKK